MPTAGRSRRLPRSRAAAVGRNGERLAALLYILRGYRVLGRRVRTGAAEVDLVCRRGGALVLVEVKRRRRAAAWTAEDGLRWRQRERLVRAAVELRRRHPWARRVRIDLVTIDGVRVRIRHAAVDVAIVRSGRARDAWS